MRNLAVKLIILVVFLTISFSCSNEEDTKEPETNDNEISDSENKDNPEQSNDDFVIGENVKFLPKKESNLISSTEDLTAGKYIIEFSGNVPELQKDDIIVGDQENGYLRKVVSVSIQGKTLTIETEPASLEELITDGKIEFEGNLSNDWTETGSGKRSNTNSKSNNGYIGFDLEKEVVAELHGTKFIIENGQFAFKPNEKFFMEFKKGNLEYFELGFVDGNIIADGTLKVEGTLAQIIPKLDFEFYSYSFVRIVPTTPLPIVVLFTVKFNIEVSAPLTSSSNVTLDFKNRYNFNSYIKYSEEQWNQDFSFTPNVGIESFEIENILRMNNIIKFVPSLSVHIFGIAGPKVDLGAFVESQVEVNYIDHWNDWNSNVDVGVDVTAGINASLLGKDIIDFSFPEKEFIRKTLYSAPDSIINFDGNEQKGVIGERLSDKLSVKIIDNFEKSLSNTNVYFEIVEGEGFLSEEFNSKFEENIKIETNNSGISEVFWALGESSKGNKVRSYVQDSNGNLISETFFVASSSNPIVVKVDSEISPSRMYRKEELKYTVTNNGDVPVTFSDGLTGLDGLDYSHTVPINQTDPSKTLEPGASIELTRNLIFYEDVDFVAELEFRINNTVIQSVEVPIYVNDNVPLEPGDIFDDGVVFYVGEDGKSGLISSFEYVSTIAQFGCFENNSLNTSRELGMGQQNTLDLLNSDCPTSPFAARVCNDYIENGFEDWYLPSEAEAVILIEQAGKIILGARSYSNKNDTLFDYFKSDPLISSTTTSQYNNEFDYYEKTVSFVSASGAYQVARNHFGTIRAVRSFSR